MIDATYVLLAIVVLTACSIITRCVYLLFGDYMPLPDAVRRALRYAPAAALVAIIVPEVVPWHAPQWPQVDLRLPATLVAVWVMLRTRSSLLTIGTGMATLWGLRWLFG